MATTIKKMATPIQIRQLHTIYRAHHMTDDDKKDILLKLTDGRTNSTKFLTAKEATYLTGYLNGSSGYQVSSPSDNDKYLRKCRSGALKRMQELGINTVQWACVNSYCEDSRIAGKPFYNLDTDDLLQLIKKLESIKQK